METKLDAIKWALDHLDETFYMAGGKKYRIVGVGFYGAEWAAICRGTSGWMSIDPSDCILSDLSKGDFNNFNYIYIDQIWEPRKKV